MVEHLTVAQDVAGSIPVTHPILLCIYGRTQTFLATLRSTLEEYTR